MAKKKEKKAKSINLDEELKKINPYIREGFERYLFENGIMIKTEEEFNKQLKKYGGF